jgi:hypothetical protein
VDFGSGEAGTASAGAANARGSASKVALASCNPAVGHSLASENVGGTAAEVSAKSAAAFALNFEETATSSCALATLTEASTSEATHSSLFIFSLFGG